MGTWEQQLEARAIRQRWPMSAERRAEIVQRMEEDATNPDVTPRDRARAAKVLHAFMASNQADEHLAIRLAVNPDHPTVQSGSNEDPATIRDRVATVAQQLGISLMVPETATRNSDVGAAGT